MIVCQLRRTVTIDENGDPTEELTNTLLTLKKQDWQPYKAENLQIIGESIKAKQWRLMFLPEDADVELTDTFIGESIEWNVFEIRRYERHTEVVLYEQS